MGRVFAARRVPIPAVTAKKMKKEMTLNPDPEDRIAELFAQQQIKITSALQAVAAVWEKINTTPIDSADMAHCLRQIAQKIEDA
jgi:hypothetical protein